MNDERLRALYERGLARRAASSSTRAGDCPPPDALLALARREGDEGARLRTLDHVMACTAGCRTELDLLRAIVQAGEGDRVERRGGDPSPLRQSSMRRWFVPVLAAASIVALGVVLGRGRAHREADTIMRGSNDGGASVALAAPPESAGVGDVATLAWHAVAGARGYTVEVLDDAGSAVATSRERSANDTTYVFRGAPAAYRWWVRADTPSGEVRSPFRTLVIRGR